MNGVILGIDTSCYTTSVAAFSLNGELIFEKRKLLEVPIGKRGLAQSEMVFQHIKALPLLLESLFEEIECSVRAIGVSAWPRRQEGSYMPVFCVGEGIARILSAAHKVPLFLFSHQEGHLWALIEEEPTWENKDFWAIQSSGGTLEGLQVTWTPSGELRAEICQSSGDISIGQLIDRVGVKAGLPFPAGPHYPPSDLGKNKRARIPVTWKENQIFLAGAETHLYRTYENNGNEMLEEALRIAAEVTCQMGERLGAKGSSVGFVGGVLSNESIRNYLKQYLSRELGFPKPAYNSDNAVGVARGTWRSWKEGMT